MTFFVAFGLLLFDSGVCLPFKQKNELTKKIKQRKIKLSWTKLKTFPEKKHQDL